MNTKLKRPARDDLYMAAANGNIPVMASTAWILAQTCLWPYSDLPVKECFDCKKYIYRLLNNASDPYNAYMEFCQRILLAKSHFIKGAYNICETPSQWFNTSNKDGYAASLILFEQLKQKRLKRPLYKHSMKAFCEAILDMAEEYGFRNFHYWINRLAGSSFCEVHELFHAWTARASFCFINPTQITTL